MTQNSIILVVNGRFFLHLRWMLGPGKKLTVNALLMENLGGFVDSARNIIITVPYLWRFRKMRSQSDLCCKKKKKKTSNSR